MKCHLLALIGLGALAVPALAQDPTQGKDQKKDQKKEEDVVKREEVVVVSASKVESTLINAPATMSVIDADTLVTSPAQNYGDLLRSVPGLNVIQMSARDINVTARQATSTLTDSQLVLLDGRSIYLDFFGLVLWDFLPQSPNEIKQIEVVRGPASAVWGANALTGVINIITKSPREAQGLAVNVTGGLINRDAGSRQGQGNGYSGGANFSYSQAPSDKLAWRLSAGYFYSDPYSRPLGQVPVIPNPSDPSPVPCVSGAQAGCVGGGVYPSDTNGLGSYLNRGTSQPKADLRLDQEFGGGGHMTYQGGYAGTTGIVHTGIGPFDIQSGSKLIYGKLQYTKSALKVSAFGNFTDASAPNELAKDPLGNAVVLGFKTQTYDFEVGNSNVIAGKHILTYGGNARRNNFNITLAPNSMDRNEFGAYLQEEFFVDKFRLVGGVRVDKFGNLDSAFWSPRVSFMYKPTPEHSLRVSFNRAFRSPSDINNYLDQNILAPRPINLSPLAPFLPPPLQPFVTTPFFLTVNNFGNTKLVAESLNAYEFAYTGSINRKTTLGFAVYQNDQNNSISFTNLTTIPVADALANGLSFYSPTDPATGVTLTGQPLTLPPVLMGILAQIPPVFGGPILLPKKVSSYLNLGPIQQRGVEVSVDHQFNREVSAYANYSYQNKPKVQTPDPGQLPYFAAKLSLPPTNRFNAGVNVNTKQLIGNLSLNFTDKAFWTDVLAPDFSGYTDSFTMVNATLGWKWAEGKVVTSLKGTNLLNKTIQQQVYGDILKLGLVFEVRIFTK
ncbi:MAG TPA: TonB-dependent receptor [Vicinamibacteria bacterium]|nr:TonB-dependent receptor [Vicinamibacteria bacterium]